MDEARANSSSLARLGGNRVAARRDDCVYGACAEGIGDANLRHIVTDREHGKSGPEHFDLPRHPDREHADPTDTVWHTDPHPDPDTGAEGRRP